MIEQALKATPSKDFPNVFYRSASAEILPFLRDKSVDMIVAGQAAHWFDPSRFWPEMKRIVRPGGTAAFWGYTDPAFPGFKNATNILSEFAYRNDALGPYWSQPGRFLVQDKLRHLQPHSEDWTDVRRIEYEPDWHEGLKGEGTMILSARMAVRDCMNYVRTWSSFSTWQDSHPTESKRDASGEGDVVDKIFDSMRDAEPAWQSDQWLDMHIDIEWGSGLLLSRRKL
ncbi:uncharacterized protein KY384_003225 [Bacidia gigantensis]|uniref:uncharacterized protein n=1 Tax=Bacidia gigantensis TaxID=2732470 RepID=UPI001D05760E|nr:uncharacterized protein KY384_003225 [Bacidia gigantensis]KAG8531595.1 hypothetical protein KY384_003225 [Bacidia gigantensis]